MHNIVIASWVPSGVKSMAETWGVNGGKVAQRLLTDERMKSVWKSLKRAKVQRSAIDGLHGWQRLSTYGIESLKWNEESPHLRLKFSIQEQACAAFYATVVTELTFERPVLTRSMLRKRAARVRAAADICRVFLHSEHDVIADPEFAGAFAIVHNYLKIAAQKIETHKNPHVLERSSKRRNDDNIRVRVNSLAAQTRKIFGICRYRTLANVVNIALQKNISASTVEKWCTERRRAQRRRPSQ